MQVIILFIAAFVGEVSAAIYAIVEDYPPSQRDDHHRETERYDHRYPVEREQFERREELKFVPLYQERKAPSAEMQFGEPRKLEKSPNYQGYGHYQTQMVVPEDREETRFGSSYKAVPVRPSRVGENRFQSQPNNNNNNNQQQKMNSQIMNNNNDLGLDNAFPRLPFDIEVPPRSPRIDNNDFQTQHFPDNQMNGGMEMSPRMLATDSRISDRSPPRMDTRGMGHQRNDMHIHIDNEGFEPRFGRRDERRFEEPPRHFDNGPLEPLPAHTWKIAFE